MPVSIGKGVPRAYVQPPQEGSPIQFGLFSAANLIEGATRHELNGVEYEPICTTDVWEWPPFCASYERPTPTRDPYPFAGHWTHVADVTATDPEGLRHPDFDGDVGGDYPPPYAIKKLDTTKGFAAGDPFAVYAGEDCLLGNHDNTTAVQNLRTRFLLGEQETVERVVYEGMLGQRPALRWNPLVLNRGEITPLGHAIGLLEHWLNATSGANGIIHAPRYMATTIGGGQIMRSSGPRAVTTLGHTYVFGTGYSGAEPRFDGGKVPPGPHPNKNAWLYATRPVTLRRSELIQPADYQSGAADQQTNTASLVVERLYVADWPCQVAAIRTDFPCYNLRPTNPVDPPPPADTKEES